MIGRTFSPEDVTKPDEIHGRKVFRRWRAVELRRGASWCPRSCPQRATVKPAAQGGGHQGSSGLAAGRNGDQSEHGPAAAAGMCGWWPDPRPQTRSDDTRKQDRAGRSVSYLPLRAIKIKKDNEKAVSLT